MMELEEMHYSHSYLIVVAYTRPLKKYERGWYYVNKLYEIIPRAKGTG